MAVRDIVRLGHPALRSTSEPVPRDEIADSELQELIDDLLETVRDAEGVGLAAPQVGVAQQLFVYESAADPAELEGSPSAPETSTLEVIINPLVEPVSEDLEFDWEGCLSIPELRGLVPRHPEVRLWGLDRHGNEVEKILSGFTARVVQHEYDHLHGVIYLDRMRDLRSLAYEDELDDLMDAEEDERPAVG
ncbi:MAG: peptide deformylase [Thermoanaerobaculia bacterium]|nr:peptide deformylase [Thermoanaerobaculia bacterium]